MFIRLLVLNTHQGICPDMPEDANRRFSFGTGKVVADGATRYVRLPPDWLRFHNLKPKAMLELFLDGGNLLVVPVNDREVDEQVAKRRGSSAEEIKKTLAGVDEL